MQLYEFQKQGVEFAVRKKKVLIADEMGLGKSAESINAVQRLQSFPCLVIAPKAVISNWKNEVAKWGGTAKILNSTFVYEVDHADFWIVNYDIVPKLTPDLLKIPYKAIILDEIHYAKNYKAKRTKAVERLLQKNYNKYTKRNETVIIGLSGTPILNHGTEIHQIAKLINPYCLGFSFGTFATHYCIHGEFGGYNLSVSKLPELNDRLQEIMIRRKKIDVLKDLPDKIRSDIELNINKNAYLAQLRMQVQIMKDQHLEEKHMILGLITRERHLTGVLKTDKIVDFLLDRLQETKEKVVVFAHHTEVIRNISNQLNNAGIGNSVYLGEMTQQQRETAIENFRIKNQVIIISIHAGGMGINLQFANYVVFAELDWSPSVLQQAEDRLHRIGQKNNVTIYYLFAKDTIDEDIIKRVISKMDIINGIIDDKEIHESKATIYEKLLRSL